MGSEIERNVAVIMSEIEKVHEFHELLSCRLNYSISLSLSLLLYGGSGNYAELARQEGRSY